MSIQKKHQSATQIMIKSCVFVMAFAFSSLSWSINHARHAAFVGTQKSAFQLAENKPQYRSKAAVLKEVKRRYKAQVLKIELDEKRGVYQIRILLPGGKVRNISVKAVK